MYPVHYIISSAVYAPADIEAALKFSEQVVSRTGLPMRIAVLTQAQLTTLNGVPMLSHNTKTFQYECISGDIATKLTISENGPEIILTICPDKSLLEKIQSFRDLLGVIVVPEYQNDQGITHWLQLHSAKDLNTNKPIAGIPPCPAEVNRAIGLVKNYFHGAGTKISIGKGNTQAIANTLIKHRIIADSDAIYQQAFLRGLDHDEIGEVVKAFTRKMPFSISTSPDYNLYWQALQDPQWERN